MGIAGDFVFEGWSGDYLTWNCRSLSKSGLRHTVMYDPRASIVSCDRETCGWARMNRDAVFDPYVGPSCQICHHLRAWHMFVWPILERMLPPRC